MTDDCDATAEAMFDPTHVHACTGKHSINGHHFCGECGRRWNRA